MGVMSRHFEQFQFVSAEGAVVRFDLDVDPEAVQLRIKLEGVEQAVTVAGGSGAAGWDQVETKLKELEEALGKLWGRYQTERRCALREQQTAESGIAV